MSYLAQVHFNNGTFLHIKFKHGLNCGEHDDNRDVCRHFFDSDCIEGIDGRFHFLSKDNILYVTFKKIGT